MKIGEKLLKGNRIKDRKGNLAGWSRSN